MAASQIVIGPDGTVLGVTGDLPPGLVDVPLDDCQNLSQELRDAGKALLRDLHGSRLRVVTRDVAIDGGSRGAGLALLLMSDICVAHGGTVEVSSSVNLSEHGTTVRLVLPTLP